ncbi:MAG TPA: DUF2294 domain-containing protein [Armatimonadota bacterium]|jgi:uncharacterized protein YbcI
MLQKTTGQLEAEISEAITRFEREYMGRGPQETRTQLLEDCVLVRLRGVLTPAETQLVHMDNRLEGRRLVKRMRTELLENARPLLDTMISHITGRGVVSMHTDISTVTGERIILFTLDKPHA